MALPPQHLKAVVLSQNHQQIKQSKAHTHSPTHSSSVTYYLHTHLCTPTHFHSHFSTRSSFYHHIKEPQVSQNYLQVLQCRQFFL